MNFLLSIFCILIGEEKKELEEKGDRGKDEEQDFNEGVIQ